MIDSLSAKQRRVAALVLLVALCALGWIAVVEPLAAHLNARSEARHEALRNLSRERGLLAQDPQVRAALESISKSPQWGRFYDAPSPEKAVLQLETDLRDLLNSPNNPTSMIALPSVSKGPLTRVAVKITLSMPIDQWSEVLGRLQSFAKLLRIENLAIQAPDYQAPDVNPALSIQAEITAFLVAHPGPQS